MFARRLQVQERLTDEIAQAVEDVVAPRGVGVVIEASHLCMMMRGVEKQNSRTITSALRGVFRECPMTRDEFRIRGRPQQALLYNHAQNQQNSSERSLQFASVAVEPGVA